MPEQRTHAYDTLHPNTEEKSLNQQSQEQQQQQDLGEKDYNLTHPTASQEAQAAHNHAAAYAEHAGEPQVVVDTESRLGRGPALLMGLTAIALGVLIFLGIHRRASAESSLEEQTQQAAVAAVSVTHPAGGAAAQEIRLPADTQSFTDTSIYSRTNGYLLKWFADIGTTVRKGQLLAIVQTPEVDQQVQQAQADVKTAQANEELANTTNERWKALLAKNAVSKQEADQAAGDLLAKQSVLNASEANLRRLQQLQGFERIYAPFDGVVTARNVDVGSLIQAGDSNTPHAELFHMNSVGTLRLFVPVPEIYVGAVRDGEQVQVTSDAFPGEKFTGTVVRNSTSIDTSTRTLKVEVDVLNQSHRLLPGQYTFVQLPIPASSGSMTLPSNTILFRAEGLRVGVVRNGHVELVPVTIGHDYGATVEITAGLQPSDEVILNPSDSLASGAPVHVEGQS